MPVVVYAAVITGDQAQGYQASFPDLPGVVVTASGANELIRSAREGLLQELNRLERAGSDWPSATPIERLREEGRAGEGAVVLVDVQIEDTPVRANISIGERLLKRLDEAAEAQDMTRSGFIAAAVRQRLGDEGAKPGVEGFASQRLYEEVAAMGRRLNETLGPDSTVGRTLADLDARALEGLRKLTELASGVGRRSKGGPADPGPHTSSET